MNRKEFLDILEKNLGKLPADEKNDAINYYRELFDEAGKDNEQQIIDDLDAPEDIAAQILMENGITSEVDPECLPDTANENSYERNNTAGPDIETVKSSNSGNNNLVLIVLILVLTSPLWGGLAAGILGTVFGLIVAVLAIIFAFSVAGIALIASGVYVMFTVPPVGLMLLGIGLMLSGVSSLIAKPVIKGLFRLGVLIVNKCVDFVKKLVNNNKRSVQ